MFSLARFGLQRFSRRLLAEAQSSEQAVIKREKTADFFKKRWLQKVLSPRQTLRSEPMGELNYSSSSQVKVLIDTREPALASALSSLNVPYTSSQLSEGDIIITSGRRQIVIERKSVEDFYNSIRTNRLFDQIGRIFDSFSKSTSSGENMLVVVLEGSLNAETTVAPAMYTAVSHMYHSLLLREKITVIRTDSVQETARLVVALGNRIPKFFASPNDFASLVHVERSGRKINGLNVPYIKLLMSIKGVSANRANAIASVYPSMDSLISALKQEGGALRLAQLVCPSHTRTVGSALGTITALNISEALLGPGHPEVSVFKLVKWLTMHPDVKMAGSEALRIGREFQSIPNLRLGYLNASHYQDQNVLEKIPISIQDVLAREVDDPHTLLQGLKGVRLISSKTAELITATFGSVRKLHSEIVETESGEEMVLKMRMVGTATQKRMIARTGIDNVLNWLRAEGFSP